MEKKIRKRVLVITERYKPEAFLINDLVAAIRDRGYEITVVTQVPSYPADRLFPGYPNRFNVTQEAGVRVIRFRTLLGYTGSLGRKMANYASFMFRMLVHGFNQALRCDTVFAYHTGPLTQAAVLLPIKLLLRKRTVIWTQDVWPDAVFAYGFPRKGAFAVLLKHFVRTLYRHCDVIAVSSPGFVDRLSYYLPSGAKAIFIPQWIPDVFLENKESEFLAVPGALNFIFAGNVGKMQNLERVIEACGTLSCDGIVLHILGDGSNRKKLESMVSERGITNVLFHSPVPQDRVRAIVSKCDFTVLSLASEPLVNLTIPAKFQAYLACGKPILCASNGEVARLVETHRLGVTADPDDAGSIANAMRKMASLADREKASMSARMENLLENEYSKKMTVDTICGFL